MTQKPGDTWIVDIDLEILGYNKNLKEIWKYMVMSQTHGNFKT